MVYNMTAWETSNNIAEGIVAIDTISGAPIVTIMIAVTTYLVIFFTVNKNNPPAESSLAASMATGISLLFLLIADLTNITWFLSFVAIAAGGTIALYLKK